MESKPKSLKRLDLWLMDHGYAPSRAKAQELIAEGAVRIKGQVVTSPARQMDVSFPFEQIQVDASEVLRYVSRGGRKLAGALHDLGLDVTGFKVLDLGQSTGGFTDCVLKAGARSVVGIDVGRGQIDSSLSGDTRIEVLEETHLRDLRDIWARDSRDKDFDLTLCDLSFISSLAQLEFILGWSKRILLLVKPQFELGPQVLNKKGLVQKPELISDLKTRFQSEIQRWGYQLHSWMPSRLPGKDGNQEYFLYAIRD